MSWPRLNRNQSIVLGVAIMVFLLAVWSILYLTTLSAAVANHLQSGLYASFRLQVASETAPLGGVIPPGSPVALLSFPAAGVHNKVVVEGTTSRNLMSGPGHRRDTVLPGQVGDSVIYGRSVAFGGVFARIANVPLGSRMTVTTGQGVFTFRVLDVRSVGSPLPAPLATGAGRLTLVTASGGGALAGWTPRSEVYVDATLVGKALPSAAVLGAVPRAEQALQPDPSALPVAILWMQLLILAVVAGVWAWFRWGRPQAWLIAGPVALAALWGLSGAAAQFLPNLL